jgi:hypothetical protein
MISYQLSIFAENKPGRLAAVTISTSDTFGVINLIVDDPARAEAVLTKAGLTVSLGRVLAVVIPDQPGGLDRLTQLLLTENVNINNAYGFVLEGHRKAVFVVSVDQIQKAEALLEKNGFQTLDAEALSTIEPFHYMKY